jgi:hypothetical protein
MMTILMIIAISMVALYVAFLLWYGGRGKPLSEAEIVQFERELGQLSTDAQGHSASELVRRLAAKDDGREFVMHNLVRYRAKALYPSGYAYGGNARAADKRYGRAALWPMLRHGSMPIFLAKCSGRFIEADDTPAWDYVAMVRYRSRRDFLRFAVAIESRDIAIHKWAAIEQTRITPLKPLASLFFVRSAVGVVFALIGLAFLLLWA